MLTQKTMLEYHKSERFFTLRRLSLAVFVVLFLSEFQLKEVKALEFCSQNDTALQLIDNGYETLEIRIAEDVPENYDILKNLETLLTQFSQTLFRLTNLQCMNKSAADKNCTLEKLLKQALCIRIIKRRAYLRYVKIHVPRSWRMGPPEIAQRIQSESNDGNSPAQLWVRNSSPRQNNPQNIWMPRDPAAYIVRPYTIKATPCGHPGTYMRLSPEFVLFGNETDVKDQLGSPDSILASEWAKLRWGVYDEVARDPDRESYYHFTNREILPTICSASIQGVDVNITSPELQCNLQEAVVNGGCRFEANAEQKNTTFSSLLYRTDLPFVQEFCDDNEDGRSVPNEIVHARLAPTKQNLHCQSRSIWSVMRSHTDFKDGQNPPLNSSIPPPVDFMYTKFLDERIVLVLDVSSSMTSFGRLGLMQQAVGYFIDIAPINTWIGIVCFSRSATIRRELEQITDDDRRQWLKEQSRCSVGMGTSIGGGILKGIRVLAKSGPMDSRGKGGKIIILTDGIEHNRPKINETLLLVERSGVTITTIAFGGQVEQALESLAFLTNGRIYAASSGEYGIDSELQEAFLSQQNSAFGGAISVYSEEISVPVDSTVEGYFIIDSTIGRNTLVTIFYQENIQALITLSSPDGEILTNESIEAVRYSVDTILNITYIRILNNAQSGNWTLRLTNPIQNRALVLRISVLSYQRQDEEPLGVTPGLLCRTVDLAGREALVIYVYIAIGEHAVLDANVGAIITRPLTESNNQDLVDQTTLFLSDNGLDPDITANDGVYSGYFVDFTASGRYNVKVFANNDDERAYRNENFLLGVGNIDFPVVNFNTRNWTSQNQSTENLRRKRNVVTRQRRNIGNIPLGNIRLGSFQRITSVAGAFVVENFPRSEFCKNGYRHFLGNCYKVFNGPLRSFEKARTTCQQDGGDLAVVRSQQALSWLLQMVRRSNMTWFGGINQRLRESGSLEIQRISSQSSQDFHDQDLDALIRHISEEETSDEFLKNFDPNLDGMSNQEINRLLAKLGIESKEDLRHLGAVLGGDSLLRKKRQTVDDEKAEPNFKDQTTPSYNIEEITTAKANEISENGVTLSAARRQPKNPETYGSGAEIPTCFWFSNGNIIESSEEICLTPASFICERPEIDLFPPSRIVNLLANFYQENKTLNLQWSAPGDDLGRGTVTGYRVRMLGASQADKVLESNFLRGEALSLADYEIDQSFPASSGVREDVVLNVSENLACPEHAILDIIIALPAVSSTEAFFDRKLITQFINSVLSEFLIDEFNIQVAAFELAPSFIPLFDFSDRFNQTDINQILSSDSINGSESSNWTISETIDLIIANGGRPSAPKVLLVLTDENIKQFSNISSIDVKIIISIGDIADKDLLWEIASEPGCKNSFVVMDILTLPSLSSDVILRLCEARSDELQAVAVQAFDEAGLNGSVSNVVTFLVRYSPTPAECIRPLTTTTTPAPSPPPSPLPVGGASATTIGLSIGIPFTTILIIIGSVMLFGQLKKYMKKRKQKKKDKEEEKKMQAMKEARLKKARNKAAAAMKANANNNSNAFKLMDIGNWRKSSKINPVV